jgi:DNA-binding response OmpR family regulator
MSKSQYMPRPREKEQNVIGVNATLESPQQASQERHEKHKVAPRRVLVVDDSQDASMSLAILLSELGYLVQTAQNGKVALELALDFLPHVILLDIVMPDMSGFALAERLRRHAELRDTLLITLTGWVDDADEWLSQHSGCDYHLLKPVDLDVLETYLVRGRRRNYGSNLVE